jgi:FkbM family methyltransferase
VKDAFGRWFDAALGAALGRLPPRAGVARAAREYVDRFDGVNDDDPATNGEHWLIERTLAGRRRPVVFDVGANLGDWTDAVLAAHSGAQVHCFEPSAATFARLQSRIGSRARLVQAAVGANPGHADLHVFPETSGLSSLHRREGLEPGWGIASQEQTERVRVETLDGYCRESGVSAIDLLKLDVEGSELDVLRGAVELLSRRAIDVVQLEYGGCNVDARVLLKDLFAFVAWHGYQMARLMPQGLRAYPRYDQRAEDFRHANWVALAPGLDAPPPGAA